MAQEVDRDKVFQTTRVRTALKNDFSWIQKAKQENKEQDNTRTDQAVGTRPAPVRQNSYVLVTAKKFEDSADQPNGEVILPQEDAQPEGSTVETTDDTKFHAVIEKLIPNAEAQPQNSEIVSPVEPAERPVSSTTTENNQQNTNTVAEVAIEHKNEVAEVSTDVHVEGCVQNGEAQPVSSAEVNLDAAAPLQPAEPPVADTTAEIKGELAGTTVDQSNIEQNEVKVSADAHVDGPVAETPVLADAGESADSTEVVAAVNTSPDNVDPVPDLLPKSELPTQPSVETTPERSCEKSHSLESIEAVAEVKVDSSPETPVVLDVAGDDATPQASVESVPDIVANSVSDSPPQPAAEGPSEETVETAAEVKVESTPATPAVTDAAGEQVATKVSVEPVPDVVANPASESPSQLAADTATEKGPSVDSVEAVADVKMESSPVTPAVTDAAGEQTATQTSVDPVTDILASPVSESPSQSAADAVIEKGSSVGSDEAVAEVESSPVMPAVSDTPGEVAPQASVEPESPSQPAAETAPEKGPSVETAVAEVKSEASSSEQGAAETVEAEAEVKVESVNPARTDLAGEQAVPQASVEPVPDLVADTVPESSTQPAEAEVKSVETEVVSATSAAPVSQTRTEEVVECEVQPVDSAAVEQSVQPTSDGVQEFKDAAELITASDANSPHKAIDLMDALDVTPPISEAAPEPLKEPEQSQTEETKLDQLSDQTNISEVSQTPVMEQQSTQTRKTRDGKSVCEFCDQIIVGRIKLIFSEPLIDCHPDCLKCSVCAKALGDLLTPMFLRDQVIQCDVCFEKTRKT